MPDPILNKVKQELQAGVYKNQINAPKQRVVGGDTGFEPLGKYDDGLLVGMDQYQNRTNNQTNSQAFGNAIAQGLAEVGFGTLEGLGYLTDFQQHWNILKGTEKDFSNFFSDIMKQAKEGVNEAMPIYGGDGFDPMNPRFWAKNTPSIMSSLSLLIPTSLAVRGLSKASQLAGLVGKVSPGTALAMKGISGAMISRYMENTMEATEVFNSEFDKLVNNGMNEEEAKLVAGKAASNTWYANLVNLPIDLMQYRILFGKTDEALAAMLKATASQKKSILEKVGNIALQMGSEGLEEGIQYGIGKEAGSSKNSIDTLTSVFKNFGEYFQDDEFKTSVLLGAVGGGIFESVGGTFDKLNQKRLNRLDKYSKAVRNDNETVIDDVTNEEISDVITQGTAREKAILEDAILENPELKEKVDRVNAIINNNADTPEDIQKDVTLSNKLDAASKANTPIATASAKIVQNLATNNTKITKQVPKADGTKESVVLPVTTEDINYAASKSMLLSLESDATNPKNTQAKALLPYIQESLKDYTDENFDYVALMKKINANPESKKLLKETKAKLKLLVEAKAIQDNSKKSVKVEEAETPEGELTESVKNDIKLYLKDNPSGLAKLVKENTLSENQYKFLAEEAAKEKEHLEKPDTSNPEAIVDYYNDKPFSLIVDYQGKYPNVRALGQDILPKESVDPIDAFLPTSKINLEPGKAQIKKETTAQAETPVEEIIKEAKDLELFEEFDIPVESPLVENVKDTEIIESNPAINEDANLVANQILYGTEDPEVATQEFLNKINERVSSKTPEYIKVEQFYITEKYGKYYFKSGEELIDEKTINKYLVRKNYDLARKVTHSGVEYYILPDNRIISLGKSSKGKEVYKTGTVRDKILDKLKPTIDSIPIISEKEVSKVIKTDLTTPIVEEQSKEKLLAKVESEPATVQPTEVVNTILPNKIPEPQSPEHIRFVKKEVDIYTKDNKYFFNKDFTNEITDPKVIEEVNSNGGKLEVIRTIFAFGNEPDFIPLTPSTYNVKTGLVTYGDKKYFLTTNLEPRKEYTLRDEGGVPIKSPFVEQTELDVDFIKSLHKTDWANKDVKIVVKNNEWNQKNTDPLTVDALLEVDGKVVGRLKSGTYLTNNLDYQALLTNLYNGYKKANGTYYSPNTFKINKLKRGDFNIQKQRNNPLAILKPNQPLVLGVGYWSPEGGTILKTNSQAEQLSASNVENGQVYLISTDLSGEKVPVRLFKKKVKEVPVLQKRLLKALANTDMEEARSIVKINIQEKGNKKSIPDLNDGMRFDKPILTSNGEFSKYNPKYNKLYENATTKDLLKKGAIIGIKNGNTYSKVYGVVSANDTGLKVVELNPSTFDRVGEGKVLDIANKNLGAYSIHYAYNYQEYYGLADRDLQIDHNLINTKEWNKEYAERLESDLVPGDHFSNGGINIEVGTLSTEQVQEVKEVVKKKPRKRKEVEVPTTEPTISTSTSALFDRLINKNTDKPINNVIVPSDVVEEIRTNLTPEENVQLEEELVSTGYTADTQGIINAVEDDFKSNGSTTVSEKSLKGKGILARIVNSIKKALLNIAIVVSFMAATSFSFPTTGPKTYAEANIENLSSWEDIKMTQDELAKLGNLESIIEFNKDGDNKYIVVDKPAGMAHMYQGDVLLNSYEVGTGKNKGDEQTVTIEKGKKVYWSLGNKQTGAGIYKIQGKGKYINYVSYFMVNERGISVPTVLHEPSQARKKYFGNNNIEDNRMSNGCVIFQAKSLIDIEKSHPDFKSGSNVYILPDDPNNKFTIKNSRLVFESDDINTNRSLAENIVTEILVKASNLTDKKVTYTESLAKNKSKLMALYPTIGDYEYNEITKIAYGIFGQESSFGTYGGPRGKFGYLKDNALISMNELGVTNTNPSVGVTQVRITSIPKKVKEAFNINRTLDIERDIEKAAISTMGVLIDIYVNQIPKALKKDYKSLLPLGYSNNSQFKKGIKGDATVYNNQYVRNVNKNGDEVTIFTSAGKKSATNIKPLFDRVQDRLSKGSIPKLRLSSIKTYKAWNREEEVTWFKSRFPDTPLHILDNLKSIGLSGQWGAFYKNAVYIYENAGEGTLYHEAFHDVATNRLDTTYFEAILDEAFHRYSKEARDSKRTELFTENVYKVDGKTYSNEQINNLVLEELLAEDFANYMLTKKSQTTSTKIKAFFTRLWELITFAYKTPKSEIDILFRNIDKGIYKSKLITNPDFAIKARFNETLKEVFSPSELEDAIDLGTHLLNKAIQEHSKNFKDKDVSEAIVTNNLDKNLLTSESIPYSVPNLLVEHYLSLPEELQNREDFVKFMNSIVISNEAGKYTKQPLYYEIQRSMKDFGYIITPKSITSTDLQITDDKVFALNEDVETRDSWGENINKISGLEKLSQKLRIFFGNIPKIKKVGDQFITEKGYLGFDKKYTAGYIYKQLQAKIGNSYSVEDMLSKVVEQSEKDALFGYIQEEFRKDKSLVTDTWIAIGQRVKPRFVSIIKDNFDKFSVRNSNVNSKNSSVQEQLYFQFENFTTLLDNKQKAINTETIKLSFNNYAKEYKATKEINTANLKALYKTIGFDINFDNLVESKVKELHSLVLGNHPKRGKALINFVTNVENYSESEIFKYLADITIDSFPTLYQDSHKNADGETVFEWIVPNYAAKTLLKLKKNKDLLNAFLQDIRYRYLPILKKDFSKFEYVIFNEITKAGGATSYENMSKKDLYLTLLASYASNKDTALIPLPVHSDSYNMSGVEIPVSRKLGTEEQDWKEGGENLIMGDLIDLAFAELIRVMNPEERQRSKGEFKYFDTLNKNKEKLIATYTVSGEQAIRNMLYQGVKEKLNTIYKKELETLKRLNIVKEDANGNLAFVDVSFSKPVKNLLSEFVANHALYYPQLSLITNGDFSYYKGIDDFYKRTKQVWSPGLALDTTDIRPTYKIKVVKDNIGSFQYEEIKDALKKLIPIDSSKHSEKFKKVDETDGGGLIDLFRYIEQEKGLGRLTPEKEQHYKDLQSGKRPKTTFNTRKPFFYGLQFDEKGIYPLQNKDSEAILVPEYGLENIGGKPNPIYNPVYKGYLEEMGYTFTTNSFTFDEKGRLEGKYIDKIAPLSTLKISDIKEGEIIELSNNDWRLQMETPLHHVNSEVVFAVQVRKHIINDLSLNENYTLASGTIIKGKDLLEEYNKIIIGDLNSSMKALNKRFSSVEDLLVMLREEIVNRQLGNQYLEALDINPVTGGTNIPLYHPSHLYRIEAIANSLFKNKVTRQKLSNGVTLVNQSSNGFNVKPKIVFNEDGSIKHLEAYVSPNNKNLDKYRDENGIIDITKVPASMKEGLVWRIPNEDKYSTIPIKVIGYLPDSIGGVLILPPEITTIGGLDFDIDKMFGFFNSENKFKTSYTYQEYINDILAKRKDITAKYGLDITSRKKVEIFFAEESELIGELANYFNIELEANDLIDLLLEEGAIVPESEFNTYEHQSKEARDQYKFDLMWGVMTSKEASKSILIGGGFERLKGITRDGILPRRSAIGNINLEKLDLLAPSTHVDIADRMLTGKGLIGISANANAAHALFQNANLYFDTSFLFDGQEFRKLGTRTDNKGNLVTRNIAETLAAFVDNGKEPQASFANINNYTVDVMEAMLSVGISLETTLYFLSQPILVNYIEHYFNNGQKETETLKAFGYSNLPKPSKDLRVENFVEKDLLDNIGKYDKKFQEDVLKAFLLYKRVAKPLTKLVLASKVGESGNGPTGSHNLFKINQFRDTEDFKGIQGVEDFFNSPLFSNKFNELLEEAAVTITAKTGIPSRTEPQFLILSNFLNGLNPFKNLNANELEFAFKNYMDYISTKDIKFNKDLIKTIPQRLARFQKVYPDNPFTSRLRTNNKGLIYYNGLNSQDKSVTDRIRYTWEVMMQEPKSRDFALDLATYSFMISGWRGTANSFSNLLPVSYLADTFKVEEYVKPINDLYVARTIISSFQDQFIRNHYKNLYYIPSFEKESAGVLKTKVKDQKTYQIILSLDEDSVIDRNKEPVQYIKFNDGTGTKLYKLVGRTGEGISYLIENDLGTYEPKLGKFFTEYEIESTRLKSAFPENDNSSLRSYFESTTTDTAKDEDVDPDINKKCKEDDL